MPTISVHGRTVRYLAGGDARAARTLVLVHAFPIGVSVWQPQIDAFSGWRAVAPALPGFDGSDAVATESVDAYADHVLAFMTALGIERACVGGLSLGGYILLAMLRRAPERVNGVILADTRSSADGAEARAGRERMLAHLASDGVPAIATEVIPKLLGPSTLRDQPATVAAARASIESQPPVAVAAAIRVMMSRPDATPILQAIQVPSLVVVGEEDAITPPEEAGRLHAGIRDSTLASIPRAGHLTSIENPDAFNGAVATFLFRVSPV